MKKLFVLTICICASSLAQSQLRFVEAPYQGQVASPPAALDVPMPPGLPSGVSPALAPMAIAGLLPGVMQAGFEVTAADINLRKALVRWTKMVGWTFEPEHWTLDRDIPVAGSASLGSDFKLAARALLSSTEMTDLPAQPCFYSNRVLRVIPVNELCSRQQAPKAQ